MCIVRMFILKCVHKNIHYMIIVDCLQITVKRYWKTLLNITTKVTFGEKETSNKLNDNYLYVVQT